MDASLTTGNDVTLKSLCQCYGIELVYEDVWGQEQSVAASVLRDLLQALGVACTTEEEQIQSLAQFKARQEESWLAPVLVLAVDEPLRIPVQISTENVGDNIAWQITSEQGQIDTGHFPVRAAPHPVSPQGRLTIDLVPEIELALGYHSLSVKIGDRQESISLIITPQRCYIPDELTQLSNLSSAAHSQRDRWWGMSAQVYGLRSETDMGVGDFAMLSELIELCGERGAAFLNLSPLHAMFPRRPAHISPYSPSSRLFLNTLLIDVRGCPDVTSSEKASALLTSESMAQKLAALQASDLVNYEEVSAAKLEILQLAFEDFCTVPISYRYSQFQAFCAEQGTTLLRHAIYEALDEHFNDGHPEMRGWPDWPAEYKTSHSATVVQFARDHAD